MNSFTDALASRRSLDRFFPHPDIQHLPEYRHLQAILVIRPQLWKVEICINAGFAAVNPALKCDSDLAVTNLAKCAALLLCDADRMLLLLGRARVVDGQHTLATQLPSNSLTHVFVGNQTTKLL